MLGCHWFRWSDLGLVLEKIVHYGEQMFEMEQRLSSRCRDEKVRSMKIVINRSWKSEQPPVTTEAVGRGPYQQGLCTLCRRRLWQDRDRLSHIRRVWPTWCLCSSIYGRTFKPGKPPVRLALKMHGLYFVELFCNKVVLVGISRPFRMKMLGKLDSYFLTLGSQCKFICSSFIHSFVHSSIHLFIHSFTCSFTSSTSTKHLLSANVLNFENETELQRHAVWPLRDMIIWGGVPSPYQQPSTIASGSCGFPVNQYASRLLCTRL